MSNFRKLLVITVLLALSVLVTICTIEVQVHRIVETAEKIKKIIVYGDGHSTTVVWEERKVGQILVLISHLSSEMIDHILSITRQFSELLRTHPLECALASSLLLLLRRPLERTLSTSST